MLGILHAQRGEFPEAERRLSSALKLNPNDASAQFNHGNVLLRLERYDEAYAALGRALIQNPSLAEAALNRGNIQMLRKRYAEAIASFEDAIRINPNYAEAYCNRGNALEELRRFDEALDSYSKALALSPQNAEIQASRANVLYRLSRLDEADKSLSTAIAQQPNNAAFHYNRGNILFKLRRYGEAYESYDRAFQLDSHADYVEGDRFFSKLMICDWTNLKAETERVLSGVRAGRPVARPFGFLAVESSQALQTRCAENFADHEFPEMTPLWKGQNYRHDRIRLAYVSGDFSDHPVSHLLAGVFECHDRARFETIAISFGKANASPLRLRLEGAFDRFVDCNDKTDADIASLMRQAEVDIAVDLMGPTEGARPAIFSHRPAPVQILYLGYAGSSGAPYMDYLLADPLVIPESAATLFREKVIYLPETFMGTDSKRVIAESTPSRAEEGLPARGFVFCAFSNTYKISEEMFNVWTQLLRDVEGSVLWLSSATEKAISNLRREAVLRGIAPERLVFARRVDLNKDHLARHRLADLFLDTLPLGAHSTVCDALWAGLPVLTCTGSTFGGRVATSLVSAIGLRELATESLASYKEQALALARDAQRLSALKSKLIRHREGFPLFDTQRFTRHLEAGFTAAWERHLAAEAPALLRVPTLAAE
jgi:protein O-GlcNAc transferase